MVKRCPTWMIRLTGSLPSHLIFAVLHLEHAATGRETFRTGVSSGIRSTPSISSTPGMVSVLSRGRASRRTGWMNAVDWRWLHEVESQTQKATRRLSCQVFRGDSSQHDKPSDHSRRLQGV